MKKLTLIFLLLILINLSCKKHDDNVCGCDSPKTENIEKLFGIVIATNDGFQILTDEKGLLIPCATLSDVFRKEGQPVIVSGTLKIPRKKIPYEFEVTPIEISELNLRSSSYDKTDITLTIIKSEDYGYKSGFGYIIEDLRTPNAARIFQPHVPAVPGLNPFCTWEQATKTGLSVIYLVRKYQDASLSVEFLEYINISSQCNQLGQ
jgi:Domain of unknown function (DUF4907)